MTYSEWRQGTLNALRVKMREQGFVPEAIDDFLLIHVQLMDVAYNYGIKEAHNDTGEN